MKRPTAALTRLRAICLGLPEAVERETWDIPTFRVRNKIFVMATTDNGGPALWCKAPPGAQAILIEAAPERFFRPPYVGHKGWIGVRLGGEVDWDEVADLVQRSYQLTAPKKLLSPGPGNITSPASRGLGPRRADQGMPPDACSGVGKRSG